MYPAGVAGLVSRYVTLPDGVTMRVVEGGPADADRGVLLVHGWGACIYSFAEMIPALIAQGHRIVAIDLPGYGLSEKPEDLGRYTTRYMSEAVALVATRLGLKRFAMIGHSMGGRIALDEAARRAAGLEKIVLVNPVGLGIVPIIPLLRPLAPKLVDRLTPLLVTKFLVRRILHVAFATPDRPTERDIQEYWAPSQFDGYARACRATLHAADWSRVPDETLAGIPIPVLVILGGRDRLVRGGADRARRIPSARVVNIARGGHIVLQECSEETNDEITRFLATG
jgi:pimeloyl-ACP methyl ester carboxylesterase